MHFLFVCARFVLSWRCTLIAVVGALRPNCELIVVPVRNTSLNLIEHIGKRGKKSKCIAILGMPGVYHRCFKRVVHTRVVEPTRILPMSADEVCTGLFGTFRNYPKMSAALDKSQRQTEKCVTQSSTSISVQYRRIIQP